MIKKNFIYLYSICGTLHQKLYTPTKMNKLNYDFKNIFVNKIIMIFCDLIYLYRKHKSVSTRKNYRKYNICHEHLNQHQLKTE